MTKGIIFKFINGDLISIYGGSPNIIKLNETDSGALILTFIKDDDDNKFKLDLFVPNRDYRINCVCCKNDNDSISYAFTIQNKYGDDVCLDGISLAGSLISYME